MAWRLVEPTVWEFQLRRDVRFHDGTPLTAATLCSASHGPRALLRGELAGRIESIAEARAVDDHTVRIETQFPDPLLWDKVRPIYIMSKRWAKAHDAPVPGDVNAGEENYASRHANGTGPFILKEFEPNGRVVMVRNPDWWGFELYPHNVDRIEYTPIADPDTRLAALLRGDLDLLTDPPFSALDRIETTPGLKLEQAARPAHHLARSRSEPCGAAFVQHQGPQSLQGQARAPGDLSGDRHRGDPRGRHAGARDPRWHAGLTRRDRLRARAGPEAGPTIPRPPRRCSPRPGTRKASA